MSLTISKKERRKMNKAPKKGNDTYRTFRIEWYLRSTSKCTSMSLGNQKGWICNLNNAPPKININS